MAQRKQSWRLFFLETTIGCAGRLRAADGVTGARFLWTMENVANAKKTVPHSKFPSTKTLSLGAGARRLRHPSGLGLVTRGKFSVRTAKKEDAASIRRLLAEWLDQPIRRTESLSRAMRRKEVLVAENDHGVVGFLHQAIREDIVDGSPNSFVAAIYVDPRHRNSGIGTALIEEAMIRAKRRGATRAELSTTSARARRFYRHHHFRHFPGEVILERVLKTHQYPHAFQHST